MKHQTFSLLIFSLIFWATATTLYGQNVEVLIKNAETAIEKKDYDAALKSLNQVLTTQPQNARALVHRARVNLFKNNNAEAIADADKSLLINPSQATAYNVRGLAKKNIGTDPNDALADFNKAIELDPNDYKPRMNRGRILWNFGKSDAALADMNRAIEMAPGIADYYYFRGALYHFLKNYPKAVEDFSKAVELAPNEDAYYANRADSYLAMTKALTERSFTQAKEDSEKALSLNAKNWLALKVRGMIKYNQKDDPAAFNDFLAARRINPDFPDWENLFTKFKWNNIPDNLMLEALDPILDKYKAAYAKDLTSYDKQLKMEFFFREIPRSFASSNPAKYSYEGYLKSLLAADPTNPCLNHYIFVKKYLSSYNNPQLLQQYETDVSNLLASNYDPKYTLCAAQMAASVAYKHYERVSNYFVTPGYDNRDFDKSVEWASKANKISYRSANGVLGNLDSVLKKNLEEWARRNPPSSLKREDVSKFTDEYSKLQKKIAESRTLSMNRALDETNERVDKFNILNESHAKSVKLGNPIDRQNLEKMKALQEEIIQICEQSLSDHSDLLVSNPKWKAVLENRIKKSRESILQVERVMKTK